MYINKLEQKYKALEQYIIKRELKGHYCSDGNLKGYPSEFCGEKCEVSANIMFLDEINRLSELLDQSIETMEMYGITEEDLEDGDSFSQDWNPTDDLIDLLKEANKIKDKLK